MDDDDESVRSLRNVTLIVNLWPFQDMVGTWELISRPDLLDPYPEHLREIIVHAKGCTDSEGRLWDLEFSEDGLHLLFDGAPLDMEGRLLHYRPRPGVRSLVFRRHGEQL